MTAKNIKAVETICEVLEKKTQRKVSRSEVAALFLMIKGKYPADATQAERAADWLIGLKRQDEWSEAIVDDDDMFKYHCNGCGKDFGPEDENDDCTQHRKCLSKDIVLNSERSKKNG